MSKRRNKRAGIKGSVFKNKPGRAKGGIGPICPRCQRPTVRWVHSASFIPPKDRGYYSEWYECLARDCKTSLIMPPQFFVSPHDPILDDLAAYEAHLRDIIRDAQP